MSYVIATTDDIEKCRALRLRVFVEEQNISIEDEIDEFDDEATHIIATHLSTPVGTARILEDSKIGKIGRVCVISEHRGTGLGKALVETSFDEICKRPHLTSAKLGAQEYAIPFYQKIGFSVVGDVYLDAGIRHFEMVRAIKR